MSAVLDTLVGDSTSEGPDPLVVLNRIRALHDAPDDVSAAVIVQVEGEYRIFATGGCAVTSDGTPLPIGDVTGVSFVLPSPVRLLAGEPAASVLVEHPAMSLALGLVPGAGVELTAVDHRDTRPEPSHEILGAAKPGGPPPFDVVSLGEGVARPPLAVVGPVAHQSMRVSGDLKRVVSAELGSQGVGVSGIRCSRSHFNNPFSSYCSVCGISMVNLTHELVTGQRPTLGFAVFDDGSGYALDRGYLIGRAPEDRDGLSALVLSDPENSVSRSHAELRLVEWDVVITDLGSTNGVHLFNEPAGQWTRLEAKVPVVLQPGARLAVGRRQFVFEAAHTL